MLVPESNAPATGAPADESASSDRLVAATTAVVAAESSNGGSTAAQSAAAAASASITVAAAQPSQRSRPPSLRLPAHKHYSHRSPWLRAAVLGANDGLVTVSSLMLGVGAGGADRQTIFLSGLSSLVAGSLSMALGEYVSVHSQRDSEEADLVREKAAFLGSPAPHHDELNELTEIYASRGLPQDLARQVAEHFHVHGGFGVDELVKVHARDELGIDTEELSNAWQASLTSMLSFALGGVLPLLGGGFIDAFPVMIGVVLAITVVGLAVFGAIGAHLGGAPMGRAALRVAVGGAAAVGITFGIGKAFGVATG